jgi:hypothetical protein
MRSCIFRVMVNVVLIAASALDGRAQESAAAGEIFFGGSKLWEHAVGGPYDNDGGPALALTGNFSRFLGVELNLVKFQDISPTPPAFGDYFRVLFGPHFACNANSRVSPFAHVLVGVTGGRQCPAPPSPCSLTSEEIARHAFTQAIGGGVDVKVYRLLWVRAIQADYVRVPFPNAAENNLQVSVGVVFRFGKL